MVENIKGITIIHCPSCHKEHEIPFNGKDKVYEMCVTCQYAAYGEYKNDN
jgi:hypothetical protein